MTQLKLKDILRAEGPDCELPAPASCMSAGGRRCTTDHQLGLGQNYDYYITY